MDIRITLKRVNLKDHICFEVPADAGLQTALRRVLGVCRDKYEDYVSCVFAPPYKPRTTGENSQNHLLNGNIMKIVNFTGNDYDTIKYCVKMIAVEQLKYPYTEIAGHIIPKRERDCNTEECAKLIEASFMLASSLGLLIDTGDNNGED